MLSISKQRSWFLLLKKWFCLLYYHLSVVFFPLCFFHWNQHATISQPILTHEKWDLMVKKAAGWILAIWKVVLWKHLHGHHLIINVSHVPSKACFLLSTLSNLPKVRIPVLLFIKCVDISGKSATTKLKIFKWWQQCNACLHETRLLWLIRLLVEWAQFVDRQIWILLLAADIFVHCTILIIHLFVCFKDYIHVIHVSWHDTTVLGFV